jgi:hypothetical protein
MDKNTVVDKSDKQRILFAKEWWPGAGSNGRHADFQGVTRVSCNHLTQLDVANPPAFPILGRSVTLDGLNRLHSLWFATANHSDAAP